MSRVLADPRARAGDRPEQSTSRTWRGGRTPGSRRSLLVGVSAVSALAAVLFWLLHDALIDDAYITLTYARNLAFHFHWGMLPGQVSNTATSPLNVLVVGAVTALVRDPMAALAVVYVGTAAALTAGLAALGRNVGVGQRLAWAGGPLLLLNPLLASALGMETTLAVALLVFLTLAAVRADARAFGIVAGLTVLTRLDLAVFVVLLFLARPALWRGVGGVAGWGALVTLPWFTFSWIVLGSAIPDTLVIKQNQGWGSFGQGLVVRYGEMFPWAILGTLVVPMLGLLALLSWPLWRSQKGVRRTGVVAALGLGGAAYFVVFLLLDVPPYFWYYGPTVGAFTICGALLLALVGSGGPVPGRRVRVALMIAIALVPSGIGWVGRAQEAVPFSHVLVHDNWGRAGQYKHLARDLRETVGDATVRAGPIEIGSIVYYCRCEVVQNFSDRGRIAGLIAERKQSSPLLRLNYHFLDTDALTRDEAEYKLAFEHGPDTTVPDWSLFTEVHGWSHIELQTVPEKRPR